MFSHLDFLRRTHIEFGRLNWLRCGYGVCARVKVHLQPMPRSFMPYECLSIFIWCSTQVGYQPVKFWEPINQSEEIKFLNSFLGLAWSGYRLDSLNSIPDRGKNCFSIPQPSDQLRPTQSIFGLKPLKRKSDHSHPSTAKVKTGWAAPPFPHSFSWGGA